MVKPLEEILKFASSDEDAGRYWADVASESFGLSRTFWVPMSTKYPYILVEPDDGDAYIPSSKCTVVEFGKPTGNKLIDSWISKHTDILTQLMNREISQKKFYQNIDEMKLLERDYNIQKALYIKKVQDNIELVSSRLARTIDAISSLPENYTEEQLNQALSKLDFLK